jgi:hypothetical protein
MAEPTGRNIPLSLARRLMGDLAYFAQKVPGALVIRRMELAAVAAARRAAAPRPGWCAVFTKAYAIVASRRPELRRAYLGFPWPHLYEHPVSVASVAIEQPAGDENMVCFISVPAPEGRSLPEIDAFLRRCREAPDTGTGAARWMLNRSRLARPLRRLLWWLGLNTSGPTRARSLGTFAVSAVAALGAASMHVLSPLATALSYGVLAPDRPLEVGLTYDQRVLDAGTAARALGELEDVLRHEVVRELGYLRALEAA